MANQLALKEAQAEQNLLHAEAKIIEEIRSKASDFTIMAARELIGRKTDSEKSSALIDKAINEVGEKLSARGQDHLTGQSKLHSALYPATTLVLDFVLP
ncbi:MAG: hypothetical protein CM1200mP4_4270 [Rhodospirillaceae bacterium]|nr:MAG: hypothetical protein CM1200mP4_4270 [Rhodospirillaceae bacterium]